MAEIWPKVAKQLATEVIGDQLVTSQMASWMVIIEQTNFLFYPIKIRLEMAEIWSKVSKQLATATLGNQRVASCMTSFIVIIKKTNLIFYPIKIRLEMAEIQSKVTKIASRGIFGRLAGGQLDGQLDYTKSVDQVSLLSHQNPT